MRQVSIALVWLLLLAFALPSIVSTLRALLVPAIILVALVGIGTLLFQRRRRW